MFRLHYNCENSGDGSAYVNFHASEADAEAADEAQPEGWGESSASYIELAIIKKKICRKELEWDGKSHIIKWVPLEEVE